MTDEQFYEDSELAGKYAGQKVKQKVIPIFDSLKKWIQLKLQEQKEIRDVERYAYIEQKKHMAAKRGRMKANMEFKQSVSGKQVQQNQGHSMNIYKEGYYD